METEEEIRIEQESYLPFGLSASDMIELALTCSEMAYDAREIMHEGILYHPSYYQNSYTDALGLIYELPDIRVLTFCGSDGLRDWSINARAIPAPYAGTMVHWGFRSAHKSIRGGIELRATVADKPLLITGHSLGGAMAELQAMRLDGRPDTHLITFGKPRTRFMPFRTHLGYLDTQLSVVLGSDLVTRLPRFLYGPDPGQSVLYLGTDGLNRYWSPKDGGDIYKFMKRDWRLSTALEDHSLASYRARLAPITDGEEHEAITGGFVDYVNLDGVQLDF